MFFIDLRVLARKLTTESVWPPNASLHPSSTCVHLRLLAGPFGKGLSLFSDEAMKLDSESNKPITSFRFGWQYIGHDGFAITEDRAFLLLIDFVC